MRACQPFCRCVTFFGAQGYPLRPTKVHQDVLSSKKLETSGRASSNKRTRYVNIRYFFVADVQKRKHLTIEYCPTDKMIGNFFTKPVWKSSVTSLSMSAMMNMDQSMWKK